MNHLGQRISITREGLAYPVSKIEIIGYDAKDQVVKTDNAANEITSINHN